MTDHYKEGWNLDNSYARLPQAFYSKMDPNPVQSPQMAVFNDSLAESLGLSGEELNGDEGAALLSGNGIPDGALPLAQAYAGHQFGHFTMLGDGRAMLLGEQITPDGKRLDIQLKGSGRTAFSRGGDGRAVLGPMLREYIISEAMHALGIPTTRSLAVVTTGEPVYRETALPGAILTRVADSHLRVGTFQYAAKFTNPEDHKALADYAIKRHYPELEAEENRYVSFLRAVISRQAALIARWQLVGFIHGVMNTDNMTISGETIDYGPCAFMDTFDPATVFSSIDTQGRYAYGNQPYMAVWNLARFAETMVPLLDEDQEQAVGLAEKEISAFSQLFTQHWLNGMRAKLGLAKEEKEDETLIKELLDLMQKHRADYTNTFIGLTFDQLENANLSGDEAFTAWRQKWQERLNREEHSGEDAKELMRNSNPAVIPRNHRVEEALAAAGKGDFQVMEDLLAVLSHPYEHSEKQKEYAALPDPSECVYKTYCGT
ncbi:protein adenylyltransferase SelO [Bacillus massiliglaciei]|uniref:protein adenylyltransferase SelO n=1 Tax=Bacillus massiliglaciei TaxID=1816693 RepID=UPI000A977437|nr:YdiU family protein [Bacillus massiliglaciei]